MPADPYAQKQNPDGSWSTSDFGGYQSTSDYKGYAGGGGGPTAFQHNPNNPYSSTWGKPGEPLFGDLSGSAPWVPNYQGIYDQYLNQFRSESDAAFNARGASLAAQRAGIGSGYSAQAGLARQGNDIALRRIGLRETGNQYDTDLARQQGGFLDQSWQLTQERHAADKGYLGKLRGFATRDYNNEMGFNDRARDLSMAQIGLDYSRSSRQATSDATARGAITSAGFHDTMSEFGQQRDISTGETTLSHDRTRTSLGSRYDRELTDLDKQGVDLDFDLRGSQLSVEEQRATLDNRLKQLDLLAQDFGLQREELANQLSKGLAALGMQKQQALAGITDAMASNDIQRQQAALGIISAARAAGDADIAAGRIK